MDTYRSLCRALTARYTPEEAKSLARWVLEEAFALTPTDCLMGKDNALRANEHKRLDNILRALLRGVPPQYAVGHTTFCGHRLAVSPDVLIPRPETEDLAGAPWAQTETPGPALDIGTGSGALAITLALAHPEREVWAWDISPEALAVAEANARALGARVRFEQRDILQPDILAPQFALIVSNPPYVRESERRDMAPHVLLHEPALALFVSDDDPLVFYRSIGRFALSHLLPQGRLMVEINSGLGPETAALFRSLGFAKARIEKDFCGRERFCCVELK